MSVRNNSFRMTWDPVSGSTGYFVNVRIQTVRRIRQAGLEPIIMVGISGVSLNAIHGQLQTVLKNIFLLF